MNLQLRPKILSQNHGDVDSTEGIHLDPDRAGSERGRHVAGADGVAPAGDDLGRARERIGIPQEHYVQAAATEHSGGRPRCALAPSSVEHLDGDSLTRCGHERRSRTRHRFGGGPEEESSAGSEQDQSSTYRKPAPVATRLFQKRRVGSRMGHPDSMR
jgi:hypothetical protein